MSRIIKWGFSLALISFALILFFYMSLGFIVEKNQAFIKECIAGKIPDYINYNFISVDSSLTQGLSVQLEDVKYEDKDNSFFAKSIGVKISIIKSLMQRSLYIDKVYAVDSDIKLNSMDYSSQNRLMMPVFVVSDKFQLTNTTLQWGSCKTKMIPYVSAERRNEKKFILFAELSGQTLNSKIHLKEEGLLVDVSSERLDIFKWLIKDHFDKLELRDVSAKFIINPENMKLESGTIISYVIYKDVKNNKYSSHFGAEFKKGLQSIKINLDNTILSAMDLYSNSIYLDKVTLLAGVYENNVFGIENLSIQQGDFTYPYVHGSISYSSDSISGRLELEHKEIPVDIGKWWVPDVLLPEVSAWVDDALASGAIDGGFFEFKNGTYKWAAELSKIDIDYDDSWPKIINSYGKLELTEKDININLNSGSIAEGKIDSILAYIDFEKDDNLKINGVVGVELRKVLSFLKTSPLDIDLSNILSTSTAEGLVDISLNLIIPMMQDVDIIVDGTAVINDASFDLSSGFKLPVENFNALVNFKQDEVFADNIIFNLDGEESTGQFFSGSGSREVKISFDSSLSQSSLSKLEPMLKDKLISGRSNYHLDVNVNYKEELGDVRYEFESDLSGLGIDLDFYNKKAKDKILTKAIFTDFKKGRQLSLKMKDLLDAQLIQESENWGGHVSLGKFAKADKGAGDNLLISGEIDNFSIGDSTNNSFSNKSKPIKLYLKTKKLLLGEYSFSNVWLSYDQERNTNRVSLDGPEIKGNVNIVDDENIKFIFDKLSLNKTNDKARKIDIIDDRISKISSVEIECEDFLYDNIELGKLRVDAIYKERGFDVSILLQQANSALQMNGIWLEPGKPSQSSEISGNWRVADFGNLMSVLGLNKDLSGGDGFVSTYLNWPGAIFEPNKEHVSGEINLFLSNGRITTVDPGFGKILGLLSIEQIARRIKLDFSDVTSKGLTYDKLSLEGKISDGILSISSLLIQSPIANISIEGTVYLKDQKLNLIMEVMPKVNDTLPVAAAVAVGNPAVGAALWVVDKVVTSKSNNSQNPSLNSKYKYWVNGTLSVPEVTKFEQMSGKKPS